MSLSPTCERNHVRVPISNTLAACPCQVVSATGAPVPMALAAEVAEYVKRAGGWGAIYRRLEADRKVRVAAGRKPPPLASMVPGEKLL